MRPPGTAGPLTAYQVAIGDVVTVRTTAPECEPPRGVIVEATDAVLVVLGAIQESGRRTTHRLPWVNVADVMTSHTGPPPHPAEE